jgi:hypothetical protein
MSDPTSMTYLKAENTFEGVKIYNTETEHNLSVPNAEKLHDELCKTLRTAAGHDQISTIAADLDPGDKLVINGTQYTVKNVLSGMNDTTTVQWQDYFGEPGEMTVPEDFEMLIWEKIE